jgi:preprotein translocase subunit YajC
MPTLILVLVLFIFAWVFLVLPQRRRQKQHAAMQDSVAPGDEIITAGGIHGTVRDVAQEDVELEIAPGVVVVLDRRAIAAKADALPDEDEDEDEELDAAEDEDQAEETLKG